MTDAAIRDVIALLREHGVRDPAGLLSALLAAPESARLDLARRLLRVDVTNLSDLHTSSRVNERAIRVIEWLAYNNTTDHPYNTLYRPLPAPARIGGLMTHHDKIWIPLLLVAIVVGTTLPCPMDVIQVGIAALSLGSKIEKLRA